MRTDILRSSAAWRATARLAVTAAGLVAIVGSGGGLGAIYCFDACGIGGPIPPSVRISPARQVVQVGAAATFSANVASFAAASSQHLQWCRRPKGADACAAIAGATGQDYTLPAANLADDGARFEATVTDANGTASGGGALVVSSAPGVVFGDGDFAPADWSVTARIGTPQGATTHAESRAASGGNPGAYRSVTYTLDRGAASVTLYHLYLGDAYDPAVRGAVYVVDAALDCARPSYVGELQIPAAGPVIEQNGRRFVANPTLFDSPWICAYPDWQAQAPVRSLAASDFLLADGPSCGATEACPDFSAQAPPLRFGFVTSIDVGPGGSGGTVVQGIDNWRVTVWRR